MSTFRRTSSLAFASVISPKRTVFRTVWLGLFRCPGVPHESAGGAATPLISGQSPYLTPRPSPNGGHGQVFYIFHELEAWDLVP
jgi:hypothetical protein